MNTQNLLAVLLVLALLPGTVIGMQAPQQCDTSSVPTDIESSFSETFDHDPSNQDLEDAFKDMARSTVEKDLGSLDCGPCEWPGGCPGEVHVDETAVSVEVFTVTSSTGEKWWRADYTITSGGKAWLTCTKCPL